MGREIPLPLGLYFFGFLFVLHFSISQKNNPNSSKLICFVMVKILGIFKYQKHGLCVFLVSIDPESLVSGECALLKRYYVVTQAFSVFC